FNKNQNAGGNAINSENLSIGSNLSFPRFIDPLRIYHLIGSSKEGDEPALIKNRLRRWLLYDATTRLNASYNRVNIHELYRYYTFTTSMIYDVIPDPYRKITIDRLGFELYVPTPTLKFQTEVLDKSKFQKESFGKYLFTGLLFRKYTSELKAPPRRKAGYFTVIHGAEISGLEVYAINRLANVISDTRNAFTLGHEDTTDNISNLIRFSHFVKGEVDVRFYYNFSSNTQFAVKFNTGLATPFGIYSTQVPYIKQFFVGGPLSNRAWQIRQLGPGSYNDPASTDLNFAFYQTGDIKLDMSAELRFPLFWYFKGALFIDAANVWTIQKDESRLGSQFEAKDFLRELGIGYGMGVRLDLDYFIIRVDVGYKLHSPYDLSSDGNRFYKSTFPKKGVIQIAVGQSF
ncbi:MAG TPA: BamA/TamA family outer membrane protein, partial [Saprospiraceae bacterium]|nr:BamA/TamA family outer membrane protein [Saprospiraceae bacterium]